MPAAPAPAGRPTPLTSQVYVLRRTPRGDRFSREYMTVPLLQTASSDPIPCICAFLNHAEASIISDALLCHKQESGLWIPTSPCFELEVPLTDVDWRRETDPLASEGLALHPLPLARCMGTARAMGIDVAVVPRITVAGPRATAPLMHHPVQPRGPIEPRRVLDLCWAIGTDPEREQ